MLLIVVIIAILLILVIIAILLIVVIIASSVGSAAPGAPSACQGGLAMLLAKRPCAARPLEGQGGGSSDLREGRQNIRLLAQAHAGLPPKPPSSRLRFAGGSAPASRCSSRSRAARDSSMSLAARRWQNRLGPAVSPTPRDSERRLSAPARGERGAAEERSAARGPNSATNSWWSSAFSSRRPVTSPSCASWRARSRS